MEQLWHHLEGQTVEQKYVLEKLLGVGRVGGVFLAHVAAEHVLRKVAVKLMPGSSLGHEFGDLIRATSLRHPHLLFCQDAGETVVGPLQVKYLVTELADETLADQLRRGPLPRAKVGELAKQMSLALAYLHGQRRINLQVKPANVLRVGTDWKLTDFVLLGELDTAHHRTEIIMGTEDSRYLPPESFHGAVSPAWDMWAFGVTLGEALTGKPWITRQSTAATELHPSLPELPPPFDAIVAGCTGADPKARMTAADVLKTLENGGVQPR